MGSFQFSFQDAVNDSSHQREWEKLLARLPVPTKGELVIGEILPSGDVSFWLERAFRRNEATMATYDVAQDELLTHPIFWNAGQVHFNEAPLPLTPKGTKPALLLDRDGVINVDSSYVYRKEDVVFMEGIVPLVAWANAQGIPVVVLTNQSGVGRGYYTEEDIKTLHQWMGEELIKRGARVDAWYYSPYHPEAIEAQYKKISYTRKPSAGMALRAAGELGLNLKESLMVGDKVSDILAHLDIETVLIQGNYKLDGYSRVCSSLAEVLKETQAHFSNR